MTRTKPLTPDSPEVRILRAFSSADNRFVSGECLARALGVSRVAVWKRMETLKAQGYGIQAVRRKGYSIAKRPACPGAAGILARFPVENAPLSLRLFDDCPSTNDAALRLLADGEPAPFACVTRRQPAGKGRRGRTWSGAHEGNVYATVAARPMIPPARASLLPIRAGLNLCRRLSRESGLDLRLKWPNDLLVKGRKTAGMLAESTVETDRVTALVFGVGLNVNQSRSLIPDELRDTATSLAAEKGADLDLEAVTAAVIEEILAAIWECADGHDEDRLADDWAALAAFQDETVEVRTGDGEAIVGTLAGIDRSGSLLLRQPAGALRSFRAGDVSLRPVP